MFMQTAATRLACAVALTFVLATSAPALDAFWHGVIDNKWHSDQFLPTGSNWFDDRPPNGSPTPVPDGVATFAKGAMNTQVVVKKKHSIHTMLFEKGVEKYDFLIDGQLSIAGDGIVNQAGTIPRLDVRSGGGLLFLNAADVLDAVGRGRGRRDVIFISNDSGGIIQFSDSSSSGAASIVNGSGASIFFEADSSAGRADIVNRGGSDDTDPGFIEFAGRSVGGNANLFNEGETAFGGESSAQRMRIETRGRGETHFSGKSTGDKARFINRVGGTLAFFGPGPLGDGTVTGGSVDNDGLVSISGETQSLVLAGNYVQGDGVLEMLVRGKKSSEIRCFSADLDGRLTVRDEGASKNKKFYRLILCNARLGQFRRVVFRGFKDRNPRIRYDKTGVILELD